MDVGEEERAWVGDQSWEEGRLAGQTPKPMIPAGSLTGGSLLSLERVKKIDQIAKKKIFSFSFLFLLFFYLFFIFLFFEVGGGKTWRCWNRYE